MHHLARFQCQVLCDGIVQSEARQLGKLVGSNPSHARFAWPQQDVDFVRRGAAVWWDEFVVQWIHHDQTPHDNGGLDGPCAVDGALNGQGMQGHNLQLSNRVGKLRAHEVMQPPQLCGVEFCPVGDNHSQAMGTQLRFVETCTKWNCKWVGTWNIRACCVHDGAVPLAGCRRVSKTCFQTGLSSTALHPTERWHSI